VRGEGGGNGCEGRGGLVVALGIYGGRRTNGYTTSLASYCYIYVLLYAALFWCDGCEGGGGGSRLSCLQLYGRETGYLLSPSDPTL